MNRRFLFSLTLAASGLVAGGNVAWAKLSKGDVKKEAQAEAKKAESAIKTACGCAVTIAFQWGDFEKMQTNAHDDEAKPRSWKNNFVQDVEGIKASGEEFCKDAGLKKKFCALKKFTIIGKGVSDTDFKKGKGGVEVYTSEQMALGSIIKDKVKEIIDN